MRSTDLRPCSETALSDARLEQGARAGGLNGRRDAHLSRPDAIKTSSCPLLLDEIDADGAPSTPSEAPPAAAAATSSGNCSGHGAAAVPSGTGKESSTTAVDAFFLGLGMPTPRGSLPLATRAALDLRVWETAHELHVGER